MTLRSSTMLWPQAFLLWLCVGLGLLPGVVVSALMPVIATVPGVGTTAGMVRGPLGMAVAEGTVATVVPATLGLALLVGLGVALVIALLTRSRFAVRRAPTWGCGGRLSAVTEYTATAFSKPLMMIFRAVYRPTREVEALAKVSPYFPQEVRYHVEIEPTFERHLYDPLLRGVMQLAERMKMLQAGSLHAYLGYVLLLGAALLIWLGGL